MRNNTRWHIVPATPARCAIILFLGLVATVGGATQLFDADGKVPVLPLVATVLGAAVAVCALAGLVWPRLRGK